MPFPKPDCRHFLGYKPCPLNPDCQSCREYRPWKGNILLIKTAAKGDVLRTTPLAAALKQKYPLSRLTWLTAPDAMPLLEGNPHIDRLLAYSLEAVMEISSQRYDLAICLDKEPHLAGMAVQVRAKRKYGFGVDRLGQLIPLDKNSKYLYGLGLSNHLKFQVNQKSYQQLVIEACGLKYRQQLYVLSLTGEELSWAKVHLHKFSRLKGKKHLVGINTGTGRAFPTKSWPKENFIRLGRLLAGHKDIGLLLLGGSEEAQLNQAIAKSCPGFINPGTSLELRQFAAVISALDLLVSADTLGMHLGIALGKRTVALFGPTCSQEIDLYQKGEKLSAGAKCSPCYKTYCPDPVCMSDLTPESVRDAVLRTLSL
ncbi:glycosyltransferase family 9 protein [candidate division TA06 bacterium]|nr:glycosyltransferase family 9 protein [candidate division TA06 bacterium]